MRKTNKTLKVTRSIVLLLCCIIFFSSFSAVYALGLGKHNNVWDNLGDDLGGSQTDTYPYNRIGQSDWSGTVKSVGMDVLYGTTHGIVLYYGEVPHDETFSKDKRIDAWNGYPYRENTSIAKTKDSVDPNVYWGTNLDKTEVSIEDLENVNTSDNIKSLRLYALSVSPTQFGFWLGNIFYIVQVFFAGLGTKIINLLVIAKNIDMAFILENLGLEELSKVANKAFIWNSEAGSFGQLSIFTAFCLLILIVSLVGYAISYARGTKKTMDLKEVLIPVFVGLIIIGMCLSGRINTLGGALSNAVAKVCNSIAAIATDSTGGSVFITEVSGDPKYENRCVQIQEMSMVNKCFIDMQICTQFGVSGIGKLNMISLPNGSSNTQYLKYDKSLDFSTEFGNNLGYYYWFADSNAADKTNKNITYPKTSPTANEEKMSSIITFLQACYNSASSDGQKESIRNIVYSFAKPHTMVGALRMFLFFGIMVLLALCLWRYVKDILVAKLKMLLALLGMAVAGPLMITGKPKLVQTGKDILGIMIISFIEITIHSIMFDAILFAVGIVISPDLLRLVVTFFLILLLWHFNKKLNEQIHKATESIERSVISSNGIVAQAKRSAHNYLRDRPARWLEERARKYDEGTSANGKSHAGNLRSRMLHLAADSASTNGKGFTKITAESIKARKKSNADYDRERLNDASKNVKQIEDEMNSKITSLNQKVNEETKAQVEAVKNDAMSWTAEEATANAAASRATIQRDMANATIAEEAKALSSYEDRVKSVFADNRALDEKDMHVDENGNLTSSDGRATCTREEFEEYKQHADALDKARKEYTEQSKIMQEEKSKFETSIENRVKVNALDELKAKNIISGDDAAAIKKKVSDGQDVTSAISATVQESRKEGYNAALQEELKVANELADKKLDSKKIGGAKRVNVEAVEAANVATLKMAQLDAGVKVSSTEEAKRLMKSVTDQTVKENQFDIKANDINQVAQKNASEIKGFGRSVKDELIDATKDSNIVAKGSARVAGTLAQGAVAPGTAVIGTSLAAAGATAAAAQEAAKSVANVVKDDIHIKNGAAASALAAQLVNAQKSGINVGAKTTDDLKQYAEAAKNAQATKKAEEKAQKAAEKAEAKAQAANKAAEEQARRDAEQQAQAQATQQRAAAAQEAARQRVAEAQAKANAAKQPPTPVGVAAAAAVPTVANATQTPAKPATPTQAAPVTKPQPTPTVTQPTPAKPTQSVPDAIKPMSQVEAERAAAAAQKAAQNAQAAAATTAQYKETITNVAKNVTAQQSAQPTRPVQVAPAQVAPKQPTQPQRPAQPQPAVQQSVTPVTPVQQTARPQTVQVQPTVNSQPSSADYKTAQQRAAEAQEQARARAQATQQNRQPTQQPTVKPQPTVVQPQVQATSQPQQTKPQPTMVQPTQVQPKPVSPTNTDQKKLNLFTQNRQAQQPADKPLTDAEKRAATVTDENLLTKAKSDEKLGFKPKDE